MEITKKILIISISLGIVVCGCAFGLYISRTHEIEQIREQIKIEQQKNEMALKILALSKRFDSIKSHFAREKDAAWFVNELTNTAKEAGIEFAFVEPLKPITDGEFLVFPVKLGFECSYEKLGQLLELIESSDTVVTVDALRVSSHLPRSSNKEDQEFYSKRFSSENRSEWLKEPRSIIVVSAYAVRNS